MSAKSSAAVGMLGRVLLTAIFVASGVTKFTQREKNLQYMKSKGMPEPALPAMLILAGLVEVGLAPAVLLGIRARASSALLALYLSVVTLIFHDFWRLSGQEREMQQMNFLKNLAIVGGLLHVTEHGAGKASIDRLLARRLGQVEPSGTLGTEAA